MSTQPPRIHDPRAPDAPPPARDAGERALHSVFRVVARNVSGLYAAVGAMLIAGVAVIVGCVALFGLLADEVMEGGTQRFDNAVLLWLNAHASPALTGIALDVTALGAGTVVWLVLLVASVYFWNTRHRWSAALLWVSIAGSGLINSVMKLFFARPRPHLFPWRVPYAGMSSFPSGHSMTAMVCYATLAYLIGRLVCSRFLRIFTFCIAGLIIVLIGVSRLYLGVHYPTDVLGGFVMGLAWASFCALGIEALRYFRHREPAAVSEQEQDLDATATDGPPDARAA